MKTYKDVYRFPLRNSQIGRVKDADNQFVFQFQFHELLLQNNIIAIINGTEKPKSQRKFIHKDGIIEEMGKEYILIRGWGNLTGTGGHNLPLEEAANVQDTFAEFIVNQLNQKP